MSETCSVCRGEGSAWDDRAGRWTVCENCGGEGYVNPYEQDEWYEEDDDDLLGDLVPA